MEVGGLAWLSSEHLALVPGLSRKLADKFVDPFEVLEKVGVGGYMACRIPLIWSANGNGNGIPFLFVSVKAYLPASVNCRQR